MWAKTLAGTDRSDIPRYLVQSDFEPFPFLSGRIMARFQSVGMTQYFQMGVMRGSSQLMTGAPPDLSSSAVIPQIPGAQFLFSFRIAADISSAVGGVESTEGSGVALAASAMRTGSSGGAGLLNCSGNGLSICGVGPFHRRVAIHPWQSQVAAWMQSDL